jgi:hypothetical protein
VTGPLLLPSRTHGLLKLIGANLKSPEVVFSLKEAKLDLSLSILIQVNTQPARGASRGHPHEAFACVLRNKRELLGLVDFMKALSLSLSVCVCVKNDCQKSH